MTVLVTANPVAPADDAAPDYATYAADLNRWRTIAGVPPEIAKRIPGFVRYGLGAERIVDAVRMAGPEKGPATPGWPDKIAAIGEQTFAKAETAGRADNAREAQRAFLEAAFWFFLARFPHILNPAGATAYRRHNEAYGRAERYFAHPVERVSITFSGGVAPALLRLPRNVTQPVPLVLVMGGIDVWKSDLETHSLAEALLARGIAVLAFDIPGTGECPIPMSSTGEQLPLAALAFARKDTRIDADRVGVYGLSFGGHLAVKVAILEPTLAGAVQNGGPVHHAFAVNNLHALPFGTRAALARIVGLAPGDVAALEATLAGFSLSAQRLLPAQTHAPLLSINGAKDELVPIRDLDYLSEQGVRHDTLIFADDRHCASEHRDLHEPFAVQWLARRMRVKQLQVNEA